MKHTLYLLFFLCTTLSLAQEESTTAPQIGVKIALGDTVMMDGLQIQFNEVLEDSRCPSDVTCVWAGRARVKLTISKDGTKAEEKEIVFGEKSDRRLGTFDEFHIEAIALTPYPTSSTMGKLDYGLIVRKFPKN